MIYNNVEEVVGEVARLVEDKLGLEPGRHTIQYGTVTNFEGYCETCYHEWDSFVVLVDGEEVYSSGYSSSYSPFGDLQDWLENYDA